MLVEDLLLQLRGNLTALQNQSTQPTDAINAASQKFKRLSDEAEIWARMTREQIEASEALFIQAVKARSRDLLAEISSKHLVRSGSMFVNLPSTS